MLYSMKEMLLEAKQNKYAVGCFNAVDLQTARGIIGAAEAQRSPVIICYAEVHLKFTPLESIVPLMLNEAKLSKVPVAVLLDHGKDFDVCMKSMQLGCNSLMYDGSELPYEQNALETAQMAKIAHALGVSIEGEIGAIARPKSGGAEGNDDDSRAFDTSLYTDPDQAAMFAQSTGVDALAVAVGTVHGVYQAKPKLDLERLRKIAAQTGLPLVLHGGSGLTDEDFKSAIDGGICKINYYTSMALNAAKHTQRMLNEAKNTVFYHNMMLFAVQSVQQEVEFVMKLFESSGKA